MIRTAITFAVFVSLAQPLYAQPSNEPAMQGATGAEPMVEPGRNPTGTNLPGVDNSATTGSTGESTSEPAPNERCELPGTAGNSNPTVDLPSTEEANPACR